MTSPHLPHPTPSAPHRVAIAGMGGFAAAHHHACAELEQEGLLKLVATCDPSPETFTPMVNELDYPRKGVRVFPDLDTLLEACSKQLDWVILPTPVPLHAQMHRACRERNLAVYLEKPPTLDPLELEEMIATDKLDPCATNVGFNFIRQPERNALRSRLRRGEFGTLQQVNFFGAWGRPETYFTRNSWAGKLTTPDGRPMPDSCFGNAMAHFVHNSLFWAGVPGDTRFAAPTEVRAALFRVNDIDGPDTVFAECRTRENLLLRFALTHACAPGTRQQEELICENAILRFDVDSGMHIDWHDRPSESIPLSPFRPVIENLRGYAAYLEGREPHPSTTLEESRPFVHLNALLYLSSQTIRPAPYETHNDPQGNSFRIAQKVETLLKRFLQQGDFPEWLDAPPLPVPAKRATTLRDFLHSG